MARYSFEAIDRNGKKFKEEAEVKDLKELKQILKQQNLILVKATKKKGRASKNNSKSDKKDKSKNKSSFFQKISNKEIVVLTRQLATLIDSGLPLLRAISILTEQAVNPKLKTLMASVKADLTEGIEFSKALAKFPKQFDKLYVNMIRAGEASGSLEVVLKRLSKSMEEAREIQGKVKNALTYPAVVVVISIGIVYGMMTFVVPRFIDMFDSFGAELPAYTLFVFNMSGYFEKYWWLILLVIVGLVIAFLKIISTEKGKYIFHSLILKLPIFGDLIRKVSVSRFTRTMSTLVESGVPILISFDIASETSGNSVIAKVILEAKESIRKGETISQPLQESGEFPIMVTQMIQVGEESGTLIDMLTKVSDFQDVEVKETITTTLAILEPMAILIMALIVGSIVIALFLPLTMISDFV